MIAKDKKTNRRKPIPLSSNPNCKDCWGRGYVRVIPTHLDAGIFREIRPCHCVKAVVKLSELENIEIEQAVVS